MKVRIKSLTGGPDRIGTFLGLVYGNEDLEVIVRVEGSLILDCVDPSRITVIKHFPSTPDPDKLKE